MLMCHYLFLLLVSEPAVKVAINQEKSEIIAGTKIMKKYTKQ